MHVAYGRTLQQYGQFLQRFDSPDRKADHQGRVYLLEAREVFRQCHAKGDLQKIERILGGTRDTPMQQLAMGT